MARSKSSNNWLREHFDDEYVKRAQRDGYRSRACYKLLELHDKDQLIKAGMTVVDLGSAPGGWSQVAGQLVGRRGTVIASDILPMEPIAGVDFVVGDFTEETVFAAILTALRDRPVDIVISDMAPNMSGMNEVDQPRSMYLVELAIDLAQKVLKPGGTFVSKVFQGEGFDALLKQLRLCFDNVQARKPAASRPRSREVYLVARGYKSTDGR